MMLYYCTVGHRSGLVVDNFLRILVLLYCVCTVQLRPRTASHSVWGCSVVVYSARYVCEYDAVLWHATRPVTCTMRCCALVSMEGLDIVAILSINPHQPVSAKPV